MNLGISQKRAKTKKEMYVTRPLSVYKQSPESLSSPPPEGPNSGYLVVQDEESLTPSCFGLCKSDIIKGLPLPSNKILQAGYGSDDEDVFFAIPVINQPLSANQYYAIKQRRKHRGEAYASSIDEGTSTCCGGIYIKDVKPRPLDPEDIYQQFEFNPSKKHSGSLRPKSVAPDSHPPFFLRMNRETSINVNGSRDFIKRNANGLNSSLRACLPDFDFPMSHESPVPVCVGKWYCPFMFIHDGKVKDQVNKSVYYEVTLEQLWERIFTCESSYAQGNKVKMDVVVPTEVVAVRGNTAVRDESHTNRKVDWFRTTGSRGEELRVGLSTLIVERMIWEEERFGWVNVNRKEGQVRLVREEEYRGTGLWARFGCYVLVERFVVKTMDGSLLMTYDFKHTHQIKTKWE